MTYTIKEVSKLTQLSISTLRYYDKEGLLPFIERTEAGYRQFEETDVAMIGIISCLKQTGMPIKDIKMFSQWVKEGQPTLQARYQLFVERQKLVENQIEELKKALDIVKHKVQFYKEALNAEGISTQSL